MEKFETIKNIVKSEYINFHENMRCRLYKRYLPANPRHDDVFIVGFPKSGMTWLNFLLANVNVAMSDMDTEITFYNSNQYIPDIHVSRLLSDPILAFPGFRMIKSHASYNPYYNFVIYIIRNPYDVMVSFYHFLKGLNQFDKDFENFIKNEKHGVAKWVEHVESWLAKNTSAQRLHLVRYEDLKKNPADELDKIYKNLGKKIKQEALDYAVEMSSFDTMKKSESFYNMNDPNYSLNFIRTGRIMGNEIDQDHKEIIRNNTIELLGKFYPELKS